MGDEPMIRQELLKSSPEIDRAREEIKDRIREDLHEVSMRFGRVTTAHALGEVKTEFNRRRFVNAYAISDEEFQELLEFTRGTNIAVADRSATSVAKNFVEIYQSMDEEDQMELDEMTRRQGREMLFAYVDLLLTDIFTENRDHYVDTICDALMEEMEC